MGIFDKKSSSSSSTSAAQTTQSTDGDSSAFGFGNLSTGRNSRIDLQVTALDGGAIAGALNFADGAFSNAAALGADVSRGALSLANDAFSDGTALTGRVLDKQTTANLEFLGQISNFSELSAKTSREQAELSERQAKFAIGTIADVNASALDQVARFGQDAQTASMKALDYVFEATKSETARLAEGSMKWIIGAAVMVAAFAMFGKK